MSVSNKAKSNMEVLADTSEGSQKWVAVPTHHANMVNLANQVNRGNGGPNAYATPDSRGYSGQTSSLAGRVDPPREPSATGVTVSALGLLGGSEALLTIGLSLALTASLSPICLTLGCVLAVLGGIWAIGSLVYMCYHRDHLEDALGLDNAWGFSG